MHSQIVKIFNWLKGTAGYSYKSDLETNNLNNDKNKSLPDIQTLLDTFEKRLSNNLDRGNAPVDQTEEINKLFVCLTKCIDNLSTPVCNKEQYDLLSTNQNILNVPSLTCDSSGTIITVNENAQKLLGGDISILGRNVNSFFNSDFLSNNSLFFNTIVNQFTSPENINPVGTKTEIVNNSNHTELAYVSMSSASFNNEIFVYITINPISAFNLIRIEDRSLKEIMNEIPETDGALVIKGSLIVDLNNLLYSKFCSKLSLSTSRIRDLENVELLKIFPRELIRILNNTFKNGEIGKTINIDFRGEQFSIFIDEFVKKGICYRLVRVLNLA